MYQKCSGALFSIREHSCRGTQRKRTRSNALSSAWGFREEGVTVWSQGSKRLRVTSLEITGDAADRLSSDRTCEGASLEQDESCEIAIRVEPGEPGTAQLVIHQNLKGPASYVDIEVDPQGTPSPSPSPSTSSSSPSPSVSSPSPSPSISSGAAGP